MRILYSLAIVTFYLSQVHGMDRPQKEALKDNFTTQQEMKPEELAALKKQVAEYLQAYFPIEKNSNSDACEKTSCPINKPTQQEKVELTEQEKKEWDRVTLRSDGSIPLTLRERVAMCLTPDPRFAVWVKENEKKDSYTEMARNMEREGADEQLIMAVIAAREEELKTKKIEIPEYLRTPSYCTWMRRFEENSKIIETELLQWLEKMQGCKKQKRELTFDEHGDLITTRVFLYKECGNEPERAYAGNLDQKRFFNLLSMLQDLQLDFNVPRKDGQLPLNVALAHGRYQAAKCLILGSCGEQRLPNGPVRLKLTDEELTKNPFLLTLIDSLEKSLGAYASRKDENGKLYTVPHNERYLKLHYLVLARYLVYQGAATEYPQELKLPDPQEHASKKGFEKIAQLIGYARDKKMDAALDLVGQEISETTQYFVKEGMEPYRLI